MTWNARRYGADRTMIKCMELQCQASINVLSDFCIRLGCFFFCSILEKHVCGPRTSAMRWPHKRESTALVSSARSIIQTQMSSLSLTKSQVGSAIKRNEMFRNRSEVDDSMWKCQIPFSCCYFYSAFFLFIFFRTEVKQRHICATRIFHKQNK